ncbi:ubiquinone biosynthesis accessory factor UbiJ [Allochromatium palmeri]|uniref:Ubiquinone biosynthesis accessory factor UbiJ n=1 Tax=Allochromatium palmeri TaxID=231048 RepID=A0A6N8ECR6_9GAMM|nr:SCP2 sterol-binding domain-containing protein [Allochromatium palmeri]MTW21290.1 sterol-binding protein [Allochromatium palmeri]
MSAGGIQIPDALLAVVEQALNRYLTLDPEGAAAFDALEGRIIAIEAKGFGTRITVIPGVRGLQLFGAYDAEPDCLIQGSPLALTRLGMTEHKEAQFVTGEVEISGDTALAQDFSAALAGLNVDWEEQLAQVIGDPFARQVGNRVRDAERWTQRTSASMTANLTEYLQEERRLLPTRYEVDAFLTQVDTVRDDVERLGARIAQLAKRAQETGIQS